MSRSGLNSPMMGRGRGLSSAIGTCEKLQHLGAADALAHHHRAGVIDAMNLEYRLRYIGPIVITSPMDGSPQSGSFQRNHSVALRCRRVGAAHSVKSGLGSPNSASSYSAAVLC
jgi:hypothetical protein